MSDNTITVMGNLTRDPELRFTTAGRAICNASVAVGHRFQRNNEWVEETSFFNLTMWGDLGEHAAASLTKGSRILVTGRLQQRSYETTEGEKRQAFDIVVDDIGPSLKWATAEIARISRDANSTAATPRTTTPAGTDTGRPGGDPVYGTDGEEPF